MTDSRIPARRICLRVGRVVWILTRYAAWSACLVTVRRRRRRPGPESRAALLLAQLGPTFVKVAQLLSTRRDQLPPAWCDRLASLLERVPAPPPGATDRALRDAYGDALPFGTLNRTPLACGSIATVHRAVLRDGRAVAVKVRRPGVADVLAVDLAIMNGLAGVLRSLPGLRRVPLDQIVRQVGSAVRRQADFEAERRSLRALRVNLSCLSYVRVPVTIDSLCRDGVVVMELMPRLRRLRAPEIPVDERRTVVLRALSAMYQMLFADGLVHCDLHPGNIYVDEDGRLVILDAGFVVRLPDRVRELFAMFFMSMARNRGARCGEIVLESAAAVSPECDRTAFIRAVAALVSASTRVPASEFSLAAFATHLFDLQRRHRIYAAPEFAFPLLALLVIEGIVNDLDRNVDFQAAAVPVLVRVLGLGWEPAGDADLDGVRSGQHTAVP
jgi:ubiquinone biosynthesis protein